MQVGLVRMQPAPAPRPAQVPQSAPLHCHAPVPSVPATAHVTPVSSPCQATVSQSVRNVQGPPGTGLNIGPPAPSVPQMLRPAAQGIPGIAPNGWINHPSFTAAPGYMAPPATMPSLPSYGTVPASGSAAAPAGGPRCQVRVQPQMSAGYQPSALSALTSPRRPGSPSKLSPGQEAAASKTSRGMRYSSAGRTYEKGQTNVATVLGSHESSLHNLTASKPVKPGSRCYRSSSCSSSLDGNSPRRVRGAFERAHSAGVRMETPHLSRGATASSSALLLEAAGPVRRSSAGNLPYSLSRQRSGRRPGSKSPPRHTGQGVSRRPSGGQPHSSRGTPGRKSTVAIAVTGGNPASAAPNLTEPEAEAEPRHSHAENYHAQMAAVAHAAQRSAYQETPSIAVKPTPAQVRDPGASAGQLQLAARIYSSEIVQWKDIQLTKLISGGSFGEVYLARQGGREVCVKKCMTGPGGAMTPEQLRNLEREINAYRSIGNRCDHIVKCIGFVFETPDLALVTEYLENGNLFDLLYVNQVALKASLRLSAANQTTQAIQYMHALTPPLVHRDLKTQNLVPPQNGQMWAVRCVRGATGEADRDFHRFLAVALAVVFFALETQGMTLASGDSKLCTSVFSVLGRQGRWPEACFLLSQRRSNEEQLDTIVYNAVIKACERSSEWSQALGWFSEVRLAEMAPDVVTFNTTITALQKGQQWQQALVMMEEVDRHVTPDAVTCAAAVQACGQGGRWDMALEIFYNARARLDVQLDVVCLNTLVSVCGRWEQWQWAIHLLEEMRPDVVTYNASMDACARGQQWQRCLTLFDEMFHSILYPTIISYNTAISACENGPWTLVLALLQDLRQQGLKARADTYSAAMAACSKAQQNDLALQLLPKVPSRFTPSRQLLVAYNTALNACAKGHYWMHSLQLLEEMSSTDVSVSPDVVSFSSALTACGKGQHWQKSLALMQDLKDRSLQMNTFLCNAAMDSYSRSSQWQATLALLEDMRKQSQQPSMVAATLAVSAAASAAERAVATDLLHHLQHFPDEAAYLGMLTACQEGSLWDLALHLLDQGRQAQRQLRTEEELPSQQLFSVAISAQKKWEAALAVLADMKQDGPQPNLVVLNAAAKVLFHCGRLSEALALYRDAEDQGLASAEWLNTGRFPEADLDLHCFPVEMAKLAVLSSLLDAALGVKRQGAGGLLLVTGAGGHGGGPVLGPVLRAWLQEMGLPVEDGDWHGTRGRLWLSEDAIQELTGSSEQSAGSAVQHQSL
ncbi:unnamed protein product [Cladocopium goreaui]|uniref:Serine/threonine-protein kinase EDR1 n=1 Tax=Cladocopium goreaui TaxID=2562237 RepID=A0A9P1GLN2_9DINO|nr:unnamed protein product [Cladocopium goreaui]